MTFRLRACSDLLIDAPLVLAAGVYMDRDIDTFYARVIQYPGVLTGNWAISASKGPRSQSDNAQ